MGEKRNCLGRYKVSLKHPDLGPWDDSRLRVCKPESDLIQSTSFTSCLDCSRVRNAPISLGENQDHTC